MNAPSNQSELALQPASQDVWEKKYQLTNKEGQPVDVDVDASFRRVARALANVEPKQKQHWYERFLYALRNGAIPAGRIMSNAGAEEYKPATSTINCTVSMTIRDSMEGILDGVHEAGITLAAGCGIGYEFSTLRPKGAFVAGVGAYTSGSLSFMNIYDAMCFTVASAGGRRGAQMGTLQVSHPDVKDFIRAKRENGRLRQFNLSLLITDEFMHAVENDLDFKTYFPVNRKEPYTDKELLWREWPSREDYMVTNEEDLVLCRVYETMKARKMWDMIMASTYDYAEPGFILIDEYNRLNNNWFCEDIRATNPCGEQGLPPHGACLLGSVNLTKFIINPFKPGASFDWRMFSEVVAIFTRMLDNVVEINGLPLPEQREEILRKRRHGMGYMGLGSALAMLGMRYGSPEAVRFTEALTKELAVVGIKTGIDLAIEKGPAPIMKEVFTITPTMLRKQPRLVEDGFQVGQKVTGRVLLGKYSRYMERIGEMHPELVDGICKEGIRFTHHSSIAPTGTISLTFGNNISNGIEPTYQHEYVRNIIRPGRATKEAVTVCSYEWLLFQHLYPGEPMPEWFSTTDTVTVQEHVNMQAAAQRWIDSSISKTINVPTDIPFEDFKNVYTYAYQSGLKGCTTFRFNPEAFQGVLVSSQDLANTTYRFKFDDGSSVEFKGNEMVEYDGDTHTAANLFDALKEGYYGKF